MSLRRWLLQIGLTVLWLYLMVGIAWGGDPVRIDGEIIGGSLQPWVYDWLAT